MFEKLLKELKQMEGMRIAVPIEADEDGYYDKECPSEVCSYQFKVHAEDWANNFKDESVYCPLCGHNAPADNFWTTEQVKMAEKQAINYVEGRLGTALRQSAQDFNRSYGNKGFLKIQMQIKGTNRNSYILPIPAMRELEQKIECPECGSRYSVLGSAFFCPCCGHNSVKETFHNSIRKIETSIKNLILIKKAVSEISSDEAETTSKCLIETGLLNGVTAFQHYCIRVYNEQRNINKKVELNAFQRLELGGDYWKELFNESYEDWLSKQEYNKLKILFQKRHLLAHCDGFVDEKYIEKSGDKNYKPGQKIVVKENDVLELISIIKKIVAKIRENLGV